MRGRLQQLGLDSVSSQLMFRCCPRDDLQSQLLFPSDSSKSLSSDLLWSTDCRVVFLVFKTDASGFGSALDTEPDFFLGLWRCVALCQPDRSAPTLYPPCHPSKHVECPTLHQFQQFQ